ncbi:MAG: hypothetical protein QOE70_4374 [Chthoniobacter sp.]|jgi:hypothetical protein|nr:hypothetical protein [Chthoniobacter sp.]
MATKPAPATLTPLVAEGLALIARLDAKRLERDAKVAELLVIDAELTAVNDALIALGAGRYRDEEGHTALVVAAKEATLSPDTFELRNADDEQLARVLAADKFKKLFDRHEYWSPKDGFGAIAGAILTPARARDLIALCLIPGQLAGGRRAYLRWN